MNDHEYAYWGGLAREERKTSLKNLQASGDAWVKVITSLLAVLTVIGITLKPDAWANRSLTLGGFDMTRLEPWLLLLVLLSLARATWHAHLAAQGTPTWVVMDPVGFRKHYLDASDKALNRLQRFRKWLTIAGGLLFVYAVITLFSSRDSNTTSLMQVTTATGMYCGTLYESKKQGQLAIRSPTGQVAALSGVTGITPVKDCFTAPLPKPEGYTRTRTVARA